MRVVVVEPPPPRDRASRARDRSRGPLSVAAFDWRDPDPVATVVVKLTYGFGGDRVTLLPEQERIAIENVPLPGRDDEIVYPCDLVPYKPMADLLVVGHAFAVGSPTQEIPIHVAVGALTRSALALSSRPRLRIPLTSVFTPDAEHPDRVGPSAIPTDALARTLDPDFDYAVHQSAPIGQRRDPFELGETIQMIGLSPQGDRAIDLPREAPRVLVSFRGSASDAELAMQADTLWIDTDHEKLVLVYRGMVATPRANLVERIAVSIEEEGEPRWWPVMLRSAARGTLAMSVDPGGDDAAPRDDEERSRIAAARADLTLGEVPPEPMLPLDTYVAISAELSEKREPRADVLSRHDLDETTWTVEERAWLEEMAERAASGDGTLAAEIGEKFIAAQDALAEPSEAARTRADWAEITAALEVSDDLPRELERRRLTLPAWMRLDRRVRREASEDEAVAEEAERLLEEARERAEMVDVESDASDEREPETTRPALLGGGDRA
jgi:hypothetical protein